MISGADGTTQCVELGLGGDSKFSLSRQFLLDNDVHPNLPAEPTRQSLEGEPSE